MNPVRCYHEHIPRVAKLSQHIDNLGSGAARNITGPHPIIERTVADALSGLPIQTIHRQFENDPGTLFSNGEAFEIELRNVFERLAITIGVIDPRLFKADVAVIPFRR